MSDETKTAMVVTTPAPSDEWELGAIVRVCQTCWMACGYDDSHGAIEINMDTAETCDRCGCEASMPIPGVQFVVPLHDCRAVDPECARVVAEADAQRTRANDNSTDGYGWQAKCQEVGRELEAIRAERDVCLESLRTLNEDRDALRAEVADLLPLADAQAFAGGVAQREIETLRAQLAAAEERAARAWEDGKNACVDNLRTFAKFESIAGHATLAAAINALVHLTPPESPDA